MIALHNNAQRLLKPYAVVNPYADQLTFTDDRTRTRRDHEKYLTLIDVITLMHQHQRPIRSTTHQGKTIDYIEATLDDIGAANRLAHEVLGTSADELPPQTRRVLSALHAMVEAMMKEDGLARRDVRFTCAQVRQVTGLSDTQARIHIERLTAMEYVLSHRGRRGQSFEYELLHDGQGAGGTHLSGLIDIEALKTSPTTASSRGQTTQFAGASRPQHGPIAGESRSGVSSSKPQSARAGAESGNDASETRAAPVRGAPSYRNEPAIPLAAAGA